MKRFFLGSLVIVMLITGCSSHAKTNESVLRLAVNEAAQSLNHIQTSGFVSANLYGNTLEGLMQYDDKGQLIGAIAESYQISEDQLTYTFDLRTAHWSNGDEVTSHDFVYGWQTRLQDSRAPYNHYYAHIENASEILKGTKDISTLGIRATSDKTLEIKLVKPTAYFLGMLQFYIFYPLNQKFYEQIGAENYGLSIENYLSNGPYTLTEFQADKGWTLHKNTKYWDAQNVDVDQINVHVVKDVTTQAVLWDKNELDILELTTDVIDKYADHALLKTALRPKINYFYISGNTEVPNELFRHHKFRAAVAHSIDKELITKNILKDGSLATDGFITKDTLTVDDQEFRQASPYYQTLLYDTSKALNYLQEAKAEMGVIDTIVIDLNFSDVGVNRKVYENVKSQIEQNLPGVSVNLVANPSSTYSALLRNKATPAAAQTWQPGYLDAEAFFPAFTSDQSQNVMQWHNDQFDTLFAKAESKELANQPLKRWELYAEMEHILLEDYAVIPLFQNGVSFLQREGVTKFQMSSVIPHIPYKYIEKE